MPDLSEMYSTCSLQVKVVSAIRPRYLTILTLLISQSVPVDVMYSVAAGSLSNFNFSVRC